MSSYGDHRRYRSSPMAMGSGNYGSPTPQVAAPVYSPGGNTYTSATMRGRTLHTHRQPDYYMAAPAPVMVQPMDDLKDDMNRRLQQQVDELRDRCNADRAENASLLKELEHMDQELQRVRMEPDPVTLRELEATREHNAALMREIDGERRKLDEEKRKHQHALDTLELEKSTLAGECKNKESLLNQIRHDLDNENKNLAKQLDQEKLQHSRTKESNQRELNDLRDNEAKRAQDFEERLRKAQVEIDTLRASATTIEGEKRKVAAEGDNLKLDLQRKAELQELAAKEAKRKQDSIDELLKTTSLLQSELDDKDATIKQIASDIEKHRKRQQALEDEVRSVTLSVQDEERIKLRYQQAYEELALAVGASDAQTKALLATGTAETLLKKQSEKEHELAVLQRELEEVKNDLESERIKVTQAERERDKHKESVLAHKEEISVIKRQLLDNTVDLRGMIAEQEHSARQVAVHESRIAELQRDLEKADDTIKSLQEARHLAEMKLTESTAEWHREKTHLESVAQRDLHTLRDDHDRELNALTGKLSEMEVEGKDQMQYAELCRALSRLLDIDLGISAAKLAGDLYHNVEMLVEESKTLKMRVKEAERERETMLQRLDDVQRHQHLHTSGGDTRHHNTLHSTTHSPQPRALTMGGSMGSSHHHHHHGADSYSPTTQHRDLFSRDLGMSSGSEAEKIRKNLVTQKLEYDRFVQDVATALGVKKLAGEKINKSILIERIQDIMSEGSLHRTVTSPRSRRHGNHAGAATTKKSGTKVGKEEHEYLQQKFRIALRTIDTLDLVIKDLQERYPDDPIDYNDGGNAALMNKENQDLHEEVHRLKTQLYNKDTDAVFAMDLGTRGEPNDVTHLRKELEKYANFYDDVLRALGHRSINIKMDTIVEEIRQLKEATLHAAGNGLGVNGMRTARQRPATTVGSPRAYRAATEAPTLSSLASNTHWKP
eukprot:m.572594 g.572594  ORF g.572594 m.572594 type:complete len:950 (-) comp22272_c0_seq1:41-2890(-)